MTCTSQSMCKARITAALEYLQHETDPIRAITMAEAQLKAARDVLDAAGITFDRAERVPPSNWPPRDPKEQLA